MTNLSPFPIDQMNLSNPQNNPIASGFSKDRGLLIRMLEHKHMLETIERFEWKNLPPELPSDIIERVLYFRFKGSLFKFGDRFHFLPFALKDEIDSYGRYIGITPVLFTGQWKQAGDGKFEKDISFATDMKFKVVYDLPSAEEGMSEDESVIYKDNCVILTDTSLHVSQDFTPMNYLIGPVIEQLVDILVLVNQDLITSAKHFYVVAKDADQKEAIEKEFSNLDRRILNGKRITVVTASLELKELTGSNVKDSARYFQSYQSIDNLRKDIIGQTNGGTFMKQEHVTNKETQANTNSGSSVIQNALRMRKDFCAIANKVFGLNIDVEIKQSEEEQLVEEPGAQTKDREGDEE